VKLVILGAPGSGKGTQAKLIAKQYGLKHLSTGDLLRAEVSKNTSLGNTISSFIDEGKFVNDDLIGEILTNNLPSNDFILDGFPRNLNQCETLNALTKIDSVIELVANQQEIVSRITGRRVHLASGRIYHTKFNPPKVSNTDDITNEPLITRKDDSKITVIKRLETYNELIKPVINFFMDNNYDYKKVSAKGDIKDIFNSINNYLSKV
jgi:adenylate kinase